MKDDALSAVETNQEYNIYQQLKQRLVKNCSFSVLKNQVIFNLGVSPQAHKCESFDFTLISLVRGGLIV